MTPGQVRTAAVAALLAGATAWGLLWYPFRLLEARGVSGATASVATYVVAVLLGIAAFPGVRAWLRRPSAALLVVALAAGWANLAYVLAVLQGEVFRVLLLFYLAPLWTVPLARLILRERISASGLAIVGCALAGAVVILWRPALGLPVPHGAAEWLGVSAGMTFALSNVMARRVRDVSGQVRSTFGALGVVVLASLWLLVFGDTAGGRPVTPATAWPLVLAVGVAVFAVGLAVQFGIGHVAANRAIVIMLFELVVAAASAHLLAGEVATWQDWLGGSLIVAAGLFSGRMEPAGEATGAAQG